MSEKRIGSSYGKLMMNTIVFAIGSFSSKVLVLLLVVLGLVLVLLGLGIDLLLQVVHLRYLIHY